MTKEKKQFKRENFGVAEFKVICNVDKVEMIIHGDHIVAISGEDVYEEIFDWVAKKLGNRIDGLK